MNLKKKVTAMAMAAGLGVMSAMTAFAATTVSVEMFGLTDSGYLYSDHSGKMVANATKDGDDVTINFKPVAMGTITGHIQTIETAGGQSGEADAAGLMSFTYIPEGFAFQGAYTKGGEMVNLVGTEISYDVVLSSGSHSTSAGAIVIK